jgi:YVTN family beta-propeller protein
MSMEFYSTDTDHGTISVLRQEGAGYEVVKQIKVGNAPRGAVKFTKTGRGFVSNTSGNTVSELDAFNHREAGRITVGLGPRGIGIVPGERHMLVSNSGSDTVSVVDLEASKELAQIPVGTDPRHMAITKDGKSAYVCLWGEGRLIKLDLTSLASGDATGVRVAGSVELGKDSNPYSLNIEPNGRYALVACNATDHVPVVDLTTDAVAHRVPVDCDDGACGARAVAFSADGRTAFVTLERTNAAVAISLESFSVKRYIQVGAAPRGIIQHNDVVAIVNFSRGTASPVTAQSVNLVPHSVTFVDLNGVDLGGTIPAEKYSQVRVGHGPCSISMFDPESVLNRASASESKVTTA